MRKKIVLLTLTAVLSCSMLACSSSKKGDSNNDTNATASPAPSVDEVKVLSADLSEYVTLGEYKGLTIDEVSATVTDKEVEAQIESTLENNKTWDKQDKSYKSKKLDQVNIDYVGKIDGKEFEGGSAEKVDLQVGNTGFIDGFDEGLVGRKAGDKFDIDTTFPESYPNNPDLAGKKAVFTITVHSVAKENVPKLTDKYVASKLSKTSKTVAEYKKEVKKSLQTQKDLTKAQGEAKNAVQAAMKNATVKEYPSDQLDYYKNLVTSYYTSMASYYGMSLEDFYKQSNYTAETWESDVVVKSAEDMLKQVMVVQAIGKKENLTVSDEEYKKELPTYLANYSLETEDALKQSYGEGAPLSIKAELLYNKVGAFLVKNDKIVKPAATATPAPTATAN